MCHLAELLTSRGRRVLHKSRTFVSTFGRANLRTLANINSEPRPTVKRPSQTSFVIIMTAQFDVLNFPNDSQSAPPNLRRSTGPMHFWSGVKTAQKCRAEAV
jgi:hypothetical protein